MSLVCVEEPGLLELPCSEIDAPTQRGSDGKYRRRLCVVVMGEFTWDARPTDQNLTRNFHRDMIAMLADANDPAVVAEASALFHAAFPPQHYSRPTCARSDFIDEKLHVLGALGRFPSVKLKTRALDVAADGSTVMGVCAGQVGRFERTVLADHRVPIANFQTEQAVTAVEAFLAGRPKARLPVHWVCSLKTSAQGLPCTPAM
ncbi:hypothetical protein DYB36_010494 [Aphanomyces astaci]|uniref:Uncharacterized protein n=1 Tax=Aphanomyces astaci TaxID=112090 RepID=A0A397B6H5_APHAT|nr:hypothetical protein DYB36_010494 [Aphanomyces astaci]